MPSFILICFRIIPSFSAMTSCAFALSLYRSVDVPVMCLYVLGMCVAFSYSAFFLYNEIQDLKRGLKMMREMQE